MHTGGKNNCSVHKKQNKQTKTNLKTHWQHQSKVSFCQLHHCSNCWNQLPDLCTGL